MYKKSYQTKNSIPKTTTYSESLEATKKLLRQRREKECFPIVNRGRLWYNKLSTEQYSELTNWYNAWLEVTDTLIIPAEPKWLNDKLIEEEIL